ncbi:hypothetical protein PINS_up007598 [Pythium insidiosum]|nr:hypothetical protein PINS_up007598 [Pythium insidiosum]
MDACQVDGGGAGLCGPATEGVKDLYCLATDYFDALQNYDRCSGEADGTPCALVYMTGDRDGDLAIYTTVNSTCRDNYRQDGRFAACDGKRLNEECMHNVIEKGNVVLKSGVCVEYDYPRNVCKVRSQKIIKMATPLTKWPVSNRAHRN